MQNFKLIAKDINVKQLYNELMAQPELWNIDTFRTSYPTSPMSKVDDILIRFPDTEKYEDIKGKDTPKIFHDDKTVIWKPVYNKLPSVKSILSEIMYKVSACNLFRVLIVRNKPCTGFEAHRDVGDKYVSMANAARYHLVINGAKGNMVRCGEEAVSMHTGELWWFDAGQEHESMNISNEDRIHMLMDFEFLP